MKRILTLFTILLLASSCDFISDIIDNPGKTEDPATGSNGTYPEYGDFVLSDEAAFLTAEDTEILFNEVGEDVIVMSSSVSAASVPEPGRIMVCPITERTPHGLLVRVVSVEEYSEGYVLKTEPVALNEAFEELHVSTDVNLNEYVESAVDGAGNVIPAEYVSADIWQEFAKSPEDTTFAIPTKAAGAGSADLSMRFPLENDWFEGYLFSDITMNVAIDITSHSIRCFDISLVKQTGVCGNLMASSAETEFECTLAELEYRLRPFLIPGTPIVLVPTLYAEETLAAKGEISLKTAMRYQYENVRYSFSYHGGSPSFVSENLSEGADSYLKFTSLDMSAELDLNMVCGGRFGIYNDSLLSFGVEASAGSRISAANEISMEDTGLLTSNPSVDVTPHLGVEAYCGSLLFGLVPGADDDRLSFSMEYELPPFDLTALPKFSDVTRKSEGGKLTVSASVGGTSLLKVDEEGFALFADEAKEPLVHLSFDSAEVKSDAVAGEAEGVRSLTFDLPSSDRSYTARPYVVADGKHYYGEDDRWVDLGLSVLWAKYNVGATSPEEYGGYYAWGETEEKSSYTWENYKYGTTDSNGGWIGEYIGSEISGTEYDVAHVKWGGGARMPKHSEIQELGDKCSWSSSTYNGVRGANVTGPNGNSIFLPFAGGRFGVELYYGGYYGYYWSGTYFDDYGYYAYGLDFYDDVDGWYYYWGYYFRCYGHSVRPVTEK